MSEISSEISVFRAPPDGVFSRSAEGLSRDNTKFGSNPGQRAFFRGRSFQRRERVRGLVFEVDRVRGEVPSWSRVASCGTALTDLVAVKEIDRRAYFSGVTSCGSVWVCPLCSSLIRTRRGVELEAGASEWVARGGSLVMMTLTVRHDVSMSLGEVRGALGSSWRKLQHRKSYESLRGFTVGIVRSTEITIGSNGWHPHLHVLLFVRPGVDSDLVRASVPSLITDWRSLVGASLGLVPSVERAIDLTFFDDAASAAQYVSKVAKELTQSNSKSGRDPFSLLDASGVDRSASVARFVEYADSMRGVQSLAWSKGLRALLGIGVAKSDEELAQEDESVGSQLLLLPRDDYYKLLRSGQAAGFLLSVEMQLEEEVAA